MQHSDNRAFSETWDGTPNLDPVAEAEPEQTPDVPQDQAPAKELHTMSPEEFRAHAAAAWADVLPKLRPSRSIADLLNGDS